MHLVRISDLPTPQLDNIGWPWTEESEQLAVQMPNGEPWPTVSIVTPSFNQGLFIEETIRSVLLQGYPNLEYIIIDGGSTDNSVDIIRKYSPWLSYWVSEPDRGQAHAINKGFELVSGEIIAWLNSDDVYLPGALRNAAIACSNESSAALLFGDALVIDSDSSVIGKFRGRTFRLREILIENLVPQQSAFVRRELAAQVGFLDQSYQFILDREWWIRLALNFPVKYVDISLAQFRIHDQSKSATLETLRWAEVSRMLFELFGSENCPNWLQGSRSLAIGNAQWRLALSHLIAGNKAKAFYNLDVATYYAPRWPDQTTNRNTIVGYAMQNHDPVQFIQDFTTLMPSSRMKQIVIKRRCLGLLYLKRSQLKHSALRRRRKDAILAVVYDPWLLSDRNHFYNLVRFLCGERAAEIIRSKVVARLAPRTLEI